MEDVQYYQVENKIKPHCTKCPSNYPVNDPIKFCRTYYGKGKERRQCGGAIERDLNLDWSLNLLKDYSVIESDNLDLFQECQDIVNRKLDEAKTGKNLETGSRKVNVQKEIEQFMRTQGINIKNRLNSKGELVSYSMYLLKSGKSKITNFAYEELQSRFEIVPALRQDGTPSPTEIEGFMEFVPYDADGVLVEPIKFDAVATKEPAKPEKLTCEACGFEAKTSLGLMAHLRKHENELAKKA